MPSAVTKWTHAWTEAHAREWLWLTGLVGVFWAVGAVDAIKGVPGHSLALWLPVLVLARARVPRPGSAFLVAGMGGLLVKFPHFHGVALWGFGAAAIVLELLLPGERARDSAWGMLVVAGLVAGLAKWGVRFLPGLLLLGLEGKSHLLAPGVTLAMHLGFGLMGGLLGGIAHRLLPDRAPDPPPAT